MRNEKEIAVRKSQAAIHLLLNKIISLAYKLHMYMYHLIYIGN